MTPETRIYILFTVRVEKAISPTWNKTFNNSKGRKPFMKLKEKNSTIHHHVLLYPVMLMEDVIRKINKCSAKDVF